MTGFLLGMLTAFWLGILTSISPCPLATNIAAISFISRRIDNTKVVFFAGIIYTAGRMLTYIVLGVLIVASMLSIPQASHFLERYMNKILGPILIVVGMVLMDLLHLSLSGSGGYENLQKRAESWGVWGAGLLGVVFALTFCPVSMVLFFGSLIPLSIKSNSSALLPAIYGIGTGLPVFLFALLLALGVQWIGKAFNKLAAFEIWVRRATGAIIIVIGIYFCLTYIFQVW
jgi:cytochrome c-type biogenesis protein